jgi:hypothetical protein
VEQPLVAVHTQAADVFLRLADQSIVHLEARWVLANDDLGRFASYHLEAYRRYRVDVHTIVLCGPSVREAPPPLHTSSLAFTPTFILLGQEQAETVVEALRARVEQGEGLRGVDKISLLLLPLMRRNEPLDRVLEQAGPVVAALPEEERAQTVGAMAGLA